MNTPPKLSFACPIKWDSMSGNERWKYCTQCGHHVANLSLLTAAERKALLERARAERVCGTYFLRLSGEMVTPEAPLTPREKNNMRRFGAAALSAAALTLAAGCVTPNKTTADNPPVPAGQPAPANDEILEVGGMLAPFEVAPMEDSENQGYLAKGISGP